MYLKTLRFCHNFLSLNKIVQVLFTMQIDLMIGVTTGVTS